MSVATHCHGCGIELPPAGKYVQRRKWCSERCRKDTLYSGRCEVCGGLTDGSTNRARPPATVCQECRIWSEAAVIDAMQRWADEHGGIPPVAGDWAHVRNGYPSHRVQAIVRVGWNELLLRAGFALRCDRRPETQEWVIKQLRAGMSVRDIARTLGVSERAIYKRVHYRGLTMAEVRGKVAA